MGEPDDRGRHIPLGDYISRAEAERIWKDRENQLSDEIIARLSDEPPDMVQSRKDFIVQVLNEEMAAGKLTEDDVQFVKQALKLKESLGILGGFVIKLVAFGAAVSAIIKLWPWRWFGT